MNETLDEPWVEPKYLPFMVTVVPTVPDVGESELIRGGSTVKVIPLDAPAVVVTATATAPAERPVGTVHLRVVSDQEVQVAGVPLNATLDEPWVEAKYLPFMVTAVPTVPDVGESELIRGGSTAKFFPFDGPTVVVTATGPVLAPSGTVHLRVVSDQEV